MKIKLEIEWIEADLGQDDKEHTQAEIKEELTQMLFEVCEEWVLRGQQPDLEFE